MTSRQPRGAAVDAAYDTNDPRYTAGVPMPSGAKVRDGETWWKVVGWNPAEGGSCTYAAIPTAQTKEAAIAWAQELRLNGDNEGRVYQNYDVLEMTFAVTVTGTVHEVPL